MPNAKVTSKGQITIPKEVRKAMKLKAGTRVDFYERSPGRFEMFAKTGSIRDLEGCVPKLGYVPTIEEMNDAILDYAAELDARTKSNARKEKPARGEAA
jgi:antitoxin PrlF